MSSTRNQIGIVVITLVALGLASERLAAQQQPAIYAHSRCYKAHPGKLGELRAFFDQKARVLGETGVQVGKFAAYTVLEAVVPRGADNNCDFIATSRFVGYPSDLAPGSDEALKKLGMSQGELGESLQSAGYLFRSNLWRAVDYVGQGREGAYVVIDLMKTQDRAQWEELESSVFKPMQQARVDAGDLLGWGASALIMPRGTGLEYDAVAYNIFPDMQATGRRPGYVALFAKVHAGKDSGPVFEKTRSSRDIVSSGMYRVLVSVPK